MAKPQARAVFSGLFGLAVLLVGAVAFAAGAFTIKTTTVAEKNGEWHVKVRIDLPKAPGMMHIPMRFTFSKEVVDERAIMQKGAEPVHHRQVLDVSPKQIQGMDVDFADASGKVFKSTYFEFDLQRASGFFEAGEYQVTLSSPDGEVGSAQKITLTGDNPPVYRGSMDFSGSGADTKKKAGPDIKNVSSGIDAGPAKTNDEEAAAVKSNEVEAVGNGGSMVPSSAFNKTAEDEAVQGHPSGCGCVVAGEGERWSLGGLGALAALGLVLVRRRR